MGESGGVDNFMRYFSVCSGIGGIELGIHQAYVDTIDRSKRRGKQKNTQTESQKRQRLVSEKSKGAGVSKGQSSEYAFDQHQFGEPYCVGYSEIDEHAIAIYKAHFPEHKNYGDIKKINEQELPDFDLLVGGFPCQTFSIAGKRAGFSDTRGTIFFDIARIIEKKQPRFLILENVKGLLSHDEGRTFGTIIATLDELGYDIQWQVLNSKDFGVPQNRERIIIVGHLRGQSRPEVFPIARENETIDRAIFADESQYRREGKLREYKGTSPTLTTAGGGGHIPLIIQKSQDYREKGSLRKFDRYSPSLRAEMGDNHPMVLQRGRGKNKGGLHDVAPTVSARSYQDNNHLISKTIRAGGQKSPQGSKQNWDSYEINGTIRRLTPIECERLQGFPDGYTKIGIYKGKSIHEVREMSDTQRYKTLGNAVTVNVFREIANRIFYK